MRCAGLLAKASAPSSTSWPSPADWSSLQHNRSINNAAKQHSAAHPSSQMSYYMRQQAHVKHGALAAVNPINRNSNESVLVKLQYNTWLEHNMTGLGLSCFLTLDHRSVGSSCAEHRCLLATAASAQSHKGCTAHHPTNDAEHQEGASYHPPLRHLPHLLALHLRKKPDIIIFSLSEHCAARGIHAGILPSLFFTVCTA